MKEATRLSLLRDAPTQLAVRAPDENAQKKTPRLRRRSNSPFARRILQAGLEVSPRACVLAAVAVAAGAAYLASFIGVFLSVFTFIFMLQYFLIGFLEERAQRRKARVIPQLAPFIDGVASALGTGFNIEAAVVQAAQGVPEGLLRSELNRVALAIEKGFSAKDALGILKDRIAGREVTSLVVAISLFASVGGHVLEPFRRLARKIREQQSVMERAKRDLVMVKQAFYLMFFLCLGVPGILLIVQPGYLTVAFNDWLGRVVIQLACVGVLVCLMIFKRLTSFRI